MFRKEQYFSDLKRKDKETIGLLSIGTFLEYFDLMLYIHMAVLLNELFFPKTDPHTEKLLMALAFCSTYVMRPIGALFFGWLGDNIGRKSTVIITTMMMAISCVVMASLPTYAQIGISAAWIVTICRVIQGMASMGEAIGAEIYITEYTKPPVQYPMVGMVSICSILGTNAALAVASLVTLNNFNWRIAFLIGAVIALVGAIARTTLRETPIFFNAKKKFKEIQEISYGILTKIEDKEIYQEKVSLKTSILFFFIHCSWPMCFYIIYMHYGSVLKHNFSFSANQVIQQNFIVSIIGFMQWFLILFLSYKINPCKIAKFRAYGFLIISIIVSYLSTFASSSTDIMIIQSLLMLFTLNTFPVTPIFLKNLPVLKRFTYTAMIYAISRCITPVICSFSLIYLVDYFGNYGLLVLMLPITIGYLLGLDHFEKLEKERVKNELYEL